MLKRLDTVIRWLGNASLAIAAAFIGLLALIGFADIIGTAFLAAPVPSALEFSEVALVVVVFMGLAYAQRRRAHVTVDIFSNQFKGWVHAASVFLALISAIAFFGFLGWRSGIAAWESVLIDERSLGLTRFPVYPAKIAMVLGCVIAVLESLRQLIHLFAGSYDADHSENASD